MFLLQHWKHINFLQAHLITRGELHREIFEQTHGFVLAGSIDRMPMRAINKLFYLQGQWILKGKHDR